MTPRAPPDDIAVAIPTYRRPAALARTLDVILACEPAPAQVLVHVDAGDDETAPMLRARYPAVMVLTSDRRMGPGGGRNKLIANAAHELVASFDDDSFPADPDYFARLAAVFRARPDVAVVASQVVERGGEFAEACPMGGSAPVFVGGGAAYRRDAFLASGGYIALPVAYGMEEVDLSLRLAERGAGVCFSPWLRVRHDTDLAHHAKARVTAGSIRNLALLAYLRYPKRYWAYGALQVARRIAWCIGAGRVGGIASGVAGIPGHLWAHRSLRAPVRPATLAWFNRARRGTPALEPLER